MIPARAPRPPEWFLVRKFLYLAIEDYKALVRKGIIKDGKAVPLSKGDPFLAHEGYVWGGIEVQELLDFFHLPGGTPENPSPAAAKAVFNLLGIDIPLSVITRGMEKNAWNTKKQHFDDL